MSELDPSNHPEHDSSPGKDRPGVFQRTAMSALFEELSAELRVLAGNLFRHQSESHILQPTALINEAWLKMQGSAIEINDRAHFFALAARVMRQILTDHARYRNRLKRGGQESARVTMHLHHLAEDDRRVDLLVINEALEKLEEEDPRMAAVVECRLLGALTVEETALVLGKSERTIKRDWQVARLWLMREIGSDDVAR